MYIGIPHKLSEEEPNNKKSELNYIEKRTRYYEKPENFIFDFDKVKSTLENNQLHFDNNIKTDNVKKGGEQRDKQRDELLRKFCKTHIGELPEDRYAELQKENKSLVEADPHYNIARSRRLLDSERQEAKKKCFNELENELKAALQEAENTNQPTKGQTILDKINLAKDTAELNTDIFILPSKDPTKMVMCSCQKEKIKTSCE